MATSDYDQDYLDRRVASRSVHQVHPEGDPFVVFTLSYSRPPIEEQVDEWLRGLRSGFNQPQRQPIFRTPHNTLYIKNIYQRKIGRLKDELHKAFSRFGKVLEVHASRTLKRRGQAWIVFEDASAALDAIIGMQGFRYEGKELEIEFSKEKSDIIAKAEGTFTPGQRMEVPVLEGTANEEAKWQFPEWSHAIGLPHFSKVEFSKEKSDITEKAEGTFTPGQRIDVPDLAVTPNGREMPLVDYMAATGLLELIEFALFGTSNITEKAKGKHIIPPVLPVLPVLPEIEGFGPFAAVDSAMHLRLDHPRKAKKARRSSKD